VIGVDAGGTATRCLVATTDGTPLRRGTAGGANPRSAGGEPAEALAEALHAALSGVDRSRVACGVVGIAGAGAAGRSAAVAATTAAWRAAGLTGQVVTVTDLEVAFAAGTPARSGLLLLAGTGAVAAACRDGAVVHRCDGYGWLLGDEGSAVWLGREGLRRVLAGLDRRAAPTALTGPVTELLTGSAPPPGDAQAHAQALIAAAHALPPAALGRLAPLVADAAATGDRAARDVVDEAVERLLHALDTVAREAPGVHPAVVLAGSVLLSPGPVADGVRAGVRHRWGVAPDLGSDGAAGAAALAIARLRGRAVPAQVHARLTGAAR